MFRLFLNFPALLALTKAMISVSASATNINIADRYFPVVMREEHILEFNVSLNRTNIKIPGLLIAIRLDGKGA